MSITLFIIVQVVGAAYVLACLRAARLVAGPGWRRNRRGTRLRRLLAASGAVRRMP
jgi:hypothetical protein